MTIVTAPLLRAGLQDGEYMMLTVDEQLQQAAPDVRESAYSNNDGIDSEERDHIEGPIYEGRLDDTPATHSPFQ